MCPQNKNPAYHFGKPGILYHEKYCFYNPQQGNFSHVAACRDSVLVGMPYKRSIVASESLFLTWLQIRGIHRLTHESKAYCCLVPSGMLSYVARCNLFSSTFITSVTFATSTQIRLYRSKVMFPGASFGINRLLFS